MNLLTMAANNLIRELRLNRAAVEAALAEPNDTWTRLLRKVEELDPATRLFLARQGDVTENPAVPPLDHLKVRGELRVQEATWALLQRMSDLYSSRIRGLDPDLAGTGSWLHAPLADFLRASLLLLAADPANPKAVTSAQDALREAVSDLYGVSSYTQLLADVVVAIEASRAPATPS